MARVCNALLLQQDDPADHLFQGECGIAFRERYKAEGEQEQEAKPHDQVGLELGENSPPVSVLPTQRPLRREQEYKRGRAHSFRQTLLQSDSRRPVGSRPAVPISPTASLSSSSRTIKFPIR